MDEERGNNILPIGELDKFIEYVSNIDLCTYTKRDKKINTMRINSIERKNK